MLNLGSAYFVTIVFEKDVFEVVKSPQKTVFLQLMNVQAAVWNLK